MKIGIITYDNGRVMCIHKQDPTKGTYIVDETDIPQPEQREGFAPVLHYTEEDGFWYEYIKNVS